MTTRQRPIRPLVLIALIAVAYLAAINRAQPLLWAVAALLSATLLTGLIWPRWLVMRLSATRTGPARAAEGERIVFRIDVDNRGWMPRFMIELVDRLPFVGLESGNANAEHLLGLAAYLPGGARRSFEVEVECEKRGFYQIGPVSVASSFPLGMADAARNSGGLQTLTVYPQVFPIAELPLAGVASQMHRGGYLLPQGTGAAEFSGLREYQRGDNPRHIHWPTTARFNALMVKEFEPLASARLSIALDLSEEANVGRGRHATLEYAIRIAASIANFSCVNRIPIRIHGQAKRELRIAAGEGEHHYQRILDELAVLDADGEVPYATVLEQVSADCQPGETVVAFLSEPSRRNDATLHALTILRNKGANLLLVHFQRTSFLADDSFSNRTAKYFDRQPEALPAMSDLGASCWQVRRGDDLARLFNP